MPPAPQAAQLAGQKQSQQQYDPSTGPPVQNAASLHTPPPQLPGRLPPAGLPAAPLPPALHFPQQPPAVEPHVQLQVPAKTPQSNASIPVLPPSQLPVPPPQPVPQSLHAPMPGKAQMQAAQLPSQPQVLGGCLCCCLEVKGELRHALRGCVCCHALLAACCSVEPVRCPASLYLPLWPQLRCGNTNEQYRLVGAGGLVATQRASWLSSRLMCPVTQADGRRPPTSARQGWRERGAPVGCVATASSW